MSNKIWIVEGSTGEYSDHVEWPVKAFTKEKDAKKFVEMCSEEYRRLKLDREARGVEYYRNKKKHPLDKRFQEDYTGTNYRCYSIELCDNIGEIYRRN